MFNDFYIHNNEMYRIVFEAGVRDGTVMHPRKSSGYPTFAALLIYFRSDLISIDH